MDESTLWLEYLTSKRNDYLKDRKINLGIDYDSDRQRWDAIIERDWDMMAERLAAGIGVEDPIKQQMGEDFFERHLMELLEDVHQVASEFHQIEFNNKMIYFVHYEDFMMLAQQGIFRLEEFALDKGRKWEKKVRELLASYDYEIIGYIDLFEEVYLHVIKK
ncbi:MAG TPA: hypothetical protein EYF95_08600 [Flavobacteriales bacterium]|jgi:hypothetical protein|nr:hypothetical protein [Flavobacteriales bacterium]